MDNTTDQQAQTLGEKTRRATSQAQQQIGEQVRTGMDSGKQRAAGALHGVAQSLLQGPGEQSAGASRYIQQAGEQVRRAADWLEQTDVDELTNKTEDFARRQPMLFIGGAFALGIIAARFLKSSSKDQQEKMYSRRFIPAPLADMPGNELDMSNTGIPGLVLGDTEFGDLSSRTSGQTFRDEGR